MSEPDLSHLLATALAQAPFGLSLVDVQGQQLLSNPAYASLIGRDHADLAGMNISVLSRESDLHWTTTRLIQMARGELREFETDMAFVLPDGDERVLHVSAWPVLVDESCEAIIGMVTPVRERSGLADARVQKLLANMDNMIWLFDRNGAVLETSGRYRSTIGYPAEFWATRTVFDVVAPEDHGRLVEMQRSLLAHPGRPFEADIDVVGADRTVHTIHAHAVNLLDDPDVAGVLVTTQNVTDERRMEHELVARTTAAEREAALRTRLVADVSHELRNPLHAMGGLSELLASADLPAESAALAATLHRQVTALTAVLDDLLDSSRLDAAPVALRVDDVVVRALVDDVVSMLSAVVDNRPLTVRATVSPAVPVCVRADGHRLRQVLSNLLGNAVKFTDRGAVELDVDMIEGDAVERDAVRFVVRDTGRGIAADELESIFEPFTSATNGGDACGAGLGLTIVQQLVSAMKGSVSVESTLGSGTTFTVVLALPASEVPPDPADPRDGAHDAALGPSTVLVVEDNAVNQLLARNQLTRLGLDPLIVASGEEALEVMGSERPPRLILMDFQLPGIDGIETTRRIRELHGSGDVVIIGVTASAMAADRAACQDAGMDDFLAKPVGLAQLRGMIAKWTAPPPAPERPDTASSRDVLATLADELGSHRVVDSLVATYLSELANRSSDIQCAAQEGDLHRVHRTAHALKSTSLMLGLTELGHLCRDLEALHDADGLAPLVAAMPLATQAAEQELRAWLDRTPTLVG